jgi:hypothetical protein
MLKRIRWTYEAEFDYILPRENGECVVGFLDEEGNPYECPTTTDPELVEKLGKLQELGLTGRLKVTVEVNEELDDKNRQYPTLISVEVIHEDEDRHLEI